MTILSSESEFESSLVSCSSGGGPSGMTMSSSVRRESRLRNQCRLWHPLESPPIILTTILFIRLFLLLLFSRCKR